MQFGATRERRHVRKLPTPQKSQRVQGGTTRERRHIRELLARPKVQRVHGGTTTERRHTRKLPAPAKFQRVQRGTTLASHSNGQKGLCFCEGVTKRAPSSLNSVLLSPSSRPPDTCEQEFTGCFLIIMVTVTPTNGFQKPVISTSQYTRLAEVTKLKLSETDWIGALVILRK